MIEDQKRRRIEDLVDEGKTNSQISQETRYARSTVIKHANPYKSRKLRGDAAHVAPEGSEPRIGKMTVTEKGDERTVGLNIDRPITTKEELIEVCKLDTSVWYVDTWECTSWNSITKDKEKEAHLHGLFRVSAKFKRIAPQPFLDAMEKLFGKLEEKAPRYLLPPMPPPKSRPFLMEMDLYDVHFGNLCWAPESGENDDLKISQGKYRDAVEDLLALTSGYPKGLVLMPVGNDLHHSDSLSNATTAGTPQDCDGRYPKMIEVVEQSVIEACERILASAAKLKIIYAPGNHDQLSSYHLCRTLAAWFRNCDRVEVDLTPRQRKYEHHGVCLFGYTHGNHVNKAKMERLPGLTAVEQPEAWFKSVCREFKLGHIHTSRTNEIMGVIIRHLSSLSGINAWHFGEQYVGNRKAAEACLYSLTEGFIANIVAKTRI